MELLLAGAALAALFLFIRRERRQRPKIWFDGVILRLEDLVAHGREMGKFHQVAMVGPSCGLLIGRLEENLKYAAKVYREVATGYSRGKQIAPAGEWLLDNYYIIEEHVKDILLTVKKGRFRDLPLLSNGSLKGAPRIYAIALEVVSHTDGGISEQALASFIEAYQEETPLTISEIWALALMVRIALVEKIRHICAQVEGTQRQWRQAESFLEKTKADRVKDKILQGEVLPTAFAEHLLELSRGDEVGRNIREAVAEKLLTHDLTIEKLIHGEHQAKAAQTTAMANAVSSLKNTAQVDWDRLFERLSLVDEILRSDPVYGAMDSDSRNHYRRRVQVLARRQKTSETRIARLAMERAAGGETPAQKHCGYYLFGEGRGANFRLRSLAYIALQVGASVAIAVLVGGLALGRGTAWALGLAILFLLPASEIVVTLVNRVLARLRKPAFLPKLEFRDGVPPEAATLVVVPALLPDVKRVEELIANLERHYLANPGENLHFALLGDFKDSAGEEGEGDGEIIEALAKGIESLNRTYSRSFFALVRKRSYSPSERKWLGWERKRGALVELNALLMGGEERSFIEPPALPRVRYVLTVDADTLLPFSVVKKLVGTIAHPLNILVLEGGKPVSGYGLIQPRIGAGVGSVNKSSFAEVMAGPGGADTYNNGVSNTYQDWFGQGIFTGKGIYDLPAAHKLLSALPENSILSHDLLEGGLLRTGLATDVELVDDFPARFESYFARSHRWARGDWQLLPWLFGRVKGKDNPLSLLSRWQIADNLRRSLVALSQVLFLFLALLAAADPWPWLLFVFATLVFPALFSLFDINWRGYLENRFAGEKPLPGGPGAWLKRLSWQFVFLPYRAWQDADAILRTIYRLFTRKNLLQWTTAAEAERAAAGNYFRRFRPVLISLGAMVLPLAAFRPMNLVYYLPLLFIWLYSPILARSVSQTGKSVVKLAAEDKALLHQLAWRTWQFYAELVDESTSYLPPDNYQEKPATGIDARTSPTNIGFYLLAILAARDFGFITTSSLVTAIEGTLTSLEKMEKWQGHLYNWYAIDELELLRPRFISTVDSGNFACMLVTLVEGLEESLSQPLFGKESARGLAEALGSTVPSFDGTLAGWEDVLAQPVSGAGEKGLELIDCYREEHAALFPQCEILVNPPDFMKGEKFSTLAGYAKRAGENPSPGNLALCYRAMLTEIDALLKGTVSWQQEYLVLWQDDLLRVEEQVRGLVNNIKGLAERLKTLLRGMDFSALYNAKADLFSIGYNVEDEKLSESNYDLLASEARLTSYLAIVQHQVPPKHWPKLGRALVRAEGGKALVSWAGTMFEYLMPLLFLRHYDNTFMGETIGAVIATQRRHGEERGLPWGVSESAYYAFDYRLNYQYKAFGIPNLGLKRGLSEDNVVSPYSTLLALPFAPRAAMANIHRLLTLGMGGRYGLYEAVDYTPHRLGEDEEPAMVESYFAHHQGMSLLSLTNFLHGDSMVRRFHRNPRVGAGDLMLQETPSRQPVLKGQAKPLARGPLQRPKEREEIVRSFGLPVSSPPKCHLLSNGCYSLLLTDSGSGYSRNGQIQVSRWRGSEGLKYGTFIFVKSLNDNRVWSATMAPLNEAPDFYRARFYQDRASYFREMRSIDTRTEIVVATEDNAEVRKVSLTNHGRKEASLEVTSYFELALANQDSDLAHPAFNNLFIETELVSEHNCLLAWRRSRRREDPVRFALHSLIVEGESVGALQYETDRGRFIGRGRDLSNPTALNQPLSNTAGQVLDPCMSLRRQIKLGAGKSAVLTFVTAQGDSRGEMLKLAAKYSDPAASQRAFDMAAARSLVERRFLNIDPELLAASQQAIGHLLFLSPTRRRFQAELAANKNNQQSLWAQGISGDNPIVLVTIEESEDIKIVEEVILAHEYWRFKGLTVDLVILHGGEGGYYEPVGDLVREMVQLNRIGDILDKGGGIFIRSRKKLLPGEQYLFHGVASLILGAGSFAKQLVSEKREMPETKEFSGVSHASNVEEKGGDLLFENGFGGFTADGKEYIITIHGRMTPAPWANVLANPEFGCLVTERGGGYVFAENSRENKLTPWSNDPVVDPAGEAIYLRDEEGGAVWTVTAAPILEELPYRVCHGQGYSIFSHHSNGLSQELTVFVPLEGSVKVSVLKLRNDSPGPRKLTATYFLKPVLGVNEEATKLHLISSWQDNTLFFRNQYSGDFPGRILWLSASLPVTSYTGDGLEFLGPAGEMGDPPALKRERLSNTVGAALQPCGAIQVAFDMEPGAVKEVVFQLGQGKGDGIESLRRQYCDRPWDGLDRVKAFWRHKVGAIRAKTPEPSLDILLGWLLYQTLVCRMWARTGFYQCGGAYGFRDQLQDAANLSLTIPALARKQILLHAGHQYREGDVQHWWHPGTNNRGVRTRFSDDLLWLPWTVAEYVERTGDNSVLKEMVHYLEGSALEAGVDERYGEATVAKERGSVYEHCRRAIDRSLRFGSNGLPLMGSGDWNDGMSSVGNLGKGESIWLGWFLYDILQRFAPLCRQEGEREAASHYLEHAEALRQALEKNGWDGRWYRRAYFDDGTPLGAAENSECSIDSIPQSWAVISGGGRRDRVEEAMGEVETHLVHEERGIILLFAPPFGVGDLKPGYIKGYIPGVRENGGQYTHAACWAVRAQALLGQGDKAMAWAQMLNPISHTGSLMECMRYKVEPYVLAADVYFASGHKGRGGWSWYTGAAGWFYRVVTEDLLGLRRRGDALIIDPCIPKDWREYSLEYTYGDCVYSIKVLNPLGLSKGVVRIEVDGVECDEIPLQATGKVAVLVSIG